MRWQIEWIKHVPSSRTRIWTEPPLVSIPKPTRDHRRYWRDQVRSPGRRVVVTRSQIDAAQPEVVLDLIQSWRETASDWETRADDYVRLVERPGGQLWSGRLAEAAINMSHGDRMTIIHGSDVIEAMANRAFRGMTETVMPKLTNVRAMIDTAERLGFIVNDDLSVSWSQRTGMSDATAEQYRQASVRFSHEIKEAAQDWWAAEQQVAEQLRKDRDRLTAPFSEPAGTRSGVQLVDHHVPLHPGGPIPQDPPPYPVNEVIAEATDLDGNHIVLRRGYYNASTTKGFGWDKIYWKHGVINPNVFKDLISHSRPVSKQGGTLTYDVQINRAHCSTSLGIFTQCNDTGESVTMRIVADTTLGRAGVPDGGQKGVITMYPVPGGSGVVEVAPDWTVTPPWVNYNAPIN